VPDIFRTLGNVTFDVALATVVDEQTGDESLAAGDRPHPV